MTTTNELLDRNQSRSASYEYGDRTIVPDTKAVVVACSDSRADPAHFLDLDVGEALVIRNAGGRVSDEVVDEVVMLNLMMGMQRGEGPGVEVLVVHHTDCGAQRLADPGVRAMLAEATGIPAEKAEALSFSDPSESVRTDVQKLRSSPLVSDEIVINGYVLDVETGILSAVS